MPYFNSYNGLKSVMNHVVEHALGKVIRSGRDPTCLRPTCPALPIPKSSGHDRPVNSFQHGSYRFDHGALGKLVDGAVNKYFL